MPWETNRHVKHAVPHCAPVAASRLPRGRLVDGAVLGDYGCRGDPFPPTGYFHHSADALRAISPSPLAWRTLPPKLRIAAKSALSMDFQLGSDRPRYAEADLARLSRYHETTSTARCSNVPLTARVATATYHLVMVCV
jgi:hypothetical protein